MFRTAIFATMLVATSAGAFEKSTLTQTLPWDADWVTAVAFLGNNRVAAGNNLGQIVVWDLPNKTEQPSLSLQGHTNVVTRLIALPDGKLLSASNDHTIRVWDLSAKPLRKDTIGLNSRNIEDLTRRKASKIPALKEASVGVLESVKTLQGHKDWVVGMSLALDGKTLVSGDEKGEIIIWDLSTGKEQRRWKTKGWIYGIAINPDASTIFASERIPLVFDSGRYSAAKLWDPKTGEVKNDLGKILDKQMIISARFSADGKHLAIGRGGEIDGTNGKVSLLDPTTGKLLKELTPGHLSGLTDLAFHPDGKHLFSSGRDTTVRIWDLASGKMVKELGQPRGGQFKDWIHAVSISPDGKMVATADMAGMVHLWELK